LFWLVPIVPCVLPEILDTSTEAIKYVQGPRDFLRAGDGREADDATSSLRSY